MDKLDLVFNTQAKRHMKKWNFSEFQKSHPSLLKAIKGAMEDMRENHPVPNDREQDFLQYLNGKPKDIYLASDVDFQEEVVARYVLDQVLGRITLEDVKEMMKSGMGGLAPVQDLYAHHNPRLYILKFRLNLNADFYATDMIDVSNMHVFSENCGHPPLRRTDEH